MLDSTNQSLDKALKYQENINTVRRNPKQKATDIPQHIEKVSIL